jgi:hypothetical protein
MIYIYYANLTNTKHCIMKLFMFVISLFFSLVSIAQNDVVLKLNGEEMAGKVTEINDDNVKFSYKGETVTYTIKKADIMKITFANGRVEFFNKPASPSETKDAPKPAEPATAGAASVVSSPEAHHNRVAVLPFKFIADRQSTDEEMGYKVQEETYAYLSKHAGVYKLVDPATTNAALLKAGVTPATVRQFTPADICNILGVEYIVGGTITQNTGTATTTQSNNANVKTNTNPKNNTNNNAKVNSTSSSSTVQNYKTSVTMNVYNDKGETIFSQEHSSVWSFDGAYKNAVEYLLKKLPIYTK